MHPPDCPSWEYENHPQRRAILPIRVAEVLTDLLSGCIDTQSVATDTREVHHRVFQELTPADCAYYAGHYRGEMFRCLRFCRVGIPSDPRVGVSAEAVAFRMRELSDEIRAGLTALDVNTLLTPRERLHCIVALACHVFVVFLTIHPYVNGNGHAGRFIVWSVMGRYGHWPRRWPVDPRPDHPYADLIKSCRDGDPVPLERSLLQTLIN
jgi:fido (protein-threonine AMPylation protein)